MEQEKKSPIEEYMGMETEWDFPTEESPQEEEGCTLEGLLEEILNDMADEPETDESETDDSWADSILAQYDRTLEEKGLGEEFFQKAEQELGEWAEDKKEREAWMEELLNEKD